MISSPSDRSVAAGTFSYSVDDLLLQQAQRPLCMTFEQRFVRVRAMTRASASPSKVPVSDASTSVCSSRHMSSSRPISTSRCPSPQHFRLARIKHLHRSAPSVHPWPASKIGRLRARIPRPRSRVEPACSPCRRNFLQEGQLLQGYDFAIYFLLRHESSAMLRNSTDIESWKRFGVEEARH